jgi:hypothetical protein
VPSIASKPIGHIRFCFSPGAIPAKQLAAIAGRQTSQPIEFKATDTEFIGARPAGFDQAFVAQDGPRRCT